MKSSHVNKILVLAMSLNSGLLLSLPKQGYRDLVKKLAVDSGYSKANIKDLGTIREILHHARTDLLACANSDKPEDIAHVKFINEELTLKFMEEQELKLDAKKRFLKNIADKYGAAKGYIKNNPKKVAAGSLATAIALTLLYKNRQPLANAGKSVVSSVTDKFIKAKNYIADTRVVKKAHDVGSAIIQKPVGLASSAYNRFFSKAKVPVVAAPIVDANLKDLAKTVPNVPQVNPGL